jgi:RimJ/RimL family protein N-acetyltransferase
MRLETERLTLIPLTGDDLKRAGKDLAPAARYYGVSLPRVGFWDRRARRRLYKVKREMIKLNPRAWLLSTTWLMVERGLQILVGEAGFKGPPAARHTVEIGYGMLEGFRGKGYMTEAVGALTEFAFSQRQYRVECVKALTLPGNTASHRVLEKNGYQRRPSAEKLWLWERGKEPI